MNTSERPWMIVDDDADDQFFFELALQKVEPARRLIKAGNGKKCLEMLDSCGVQELPAIIFLDINMPVMDGKETLRALREDSRYNGISIIMYTTSADPKDVKSAIDAGATDCITKAHNINDLVAIIEDICEKYAH